jgi:P27 family predicted phage terminase small subunit
MSEKLPTPPLHLQPATKRWWKSIVETFDLESHHLRLLQAACESWDRMQAARAVLDEKGVTYQNRFGDPCARPEVAIERDAKVSFARLVRELNLDSAPGPDGPRPPALNR